MHGGSLIVVARDAIMWKAGGLEPLAEVRVASRLLVLDEISGQDECLRSRLMGQGEIENGLEAESGGEPEQLAIRLGEEVWIRQLKNL